MSKIGILWAPAKDDGTGRVDPDASTGLFEYKPLVSASTPVEPPAAAPDPKSVRPVGPPAPPAATGEPSPPGAEATPTPLSEVVLPPSSAEVQARAARDYYSNEVPQGREHSSGDAAVALSGEQYLKQRVAPIPPPAENPLSAIYGGARRSAIIQTPAPFDAAATTTRTSGGKFTMRDGTPGKDHEALMSPLAWMLAKLAVAGMVVGSLILVPMRLTTATGESQSVSLGWWLVRQVVMDPEESLLRGVPASERPGVITVYRANKAHAALVRLYATNGQMPADVLQLSEQRFIASERLIDGWGNLFACELLDGKPVIRSAGSNGIMNDGDDLIADGETVSMR